MHPQKVGTNGLAIFAILFILGSGFVAYAAPGLGSSPTGGANNPPGPPPGAPGVGNGLSYSLLPLPAYLRQQVPANYSFKEGGALMVASGDELQVKTSFLGSPKTAFTTVVQTASQNITVGSVTTAERGAAFFSGNVTLQPGTYEVGLLVFLSNEPASPVGVSVPRTIQVTLPGTSQQTTTSSTSTTESNTTATGGPPPSSPPPSSADELRFAPIAVPDAPHDYSYGHGMGGYAIAAGGIRFSLIFSGQNPTTDYSLVLSVNGSDRTIGNYATDAKGDGSVVADAALGPGAFVLGLTVVDSSNFQSPTPVLASVPSAFAVKIGGAVESTTTNTSSSSASRGPEWAFKLVPAAVENVPEGYRFATTGTALVSLDAQSSLLNVVIGFQNANPSTTYDASLALNGTSVDLGSMTTNRLGQAVLHASTQVSPGRYLLGVMVFDVSNVASFKAPGPVLVLVGNPSTQLAVVSPPQTESSSTSTTTSNSSQTSPTQPEVTTTVTTTVTTINAGTAVQAQIQRAVDNLTIPATVQVTPLSSSTSVFDPRFSVSVGHQVGNGLVIAISGENVTGPRVLLINMSKTAPLALYPALNVTLDGMPVAEASSAVQVLNPVSTNPPYYVLVATSSSVQLLVSIPHFSLHLIQIAGLLVHNIQSSLELDAPLLVGSILVITLAFAGAYAARKRYFSILP